MTNENYEKLAVKRAKSLAKNFTAPTLEDKIRFNEIPNSFRHQVHLMCISSESFKAGLDKFDALMEKCFNTAFDETNHKPS